MLVASATPVVNAAEKVRVDAGAEAQVYPAGVIGAVRAHFLLSAHDVLTARAGYNRASRGDFGEHDDEDGGGPGFALGYRRLFSERRGFFAGARVDLWWMTIDWIDDPGQPNERAGSSDIFVVQPTVEGGYSFVLGRKGRWVVEPSLAVGFEINVQTDGEDVGEGAILLGGVSVAYRF
jgi:hypothetical protein